MTQVVAAILQNVGNVSMCPRSPDQSHLLKCEFPCGKFEPVEIVEQSPSRELEEELVIHGAAGDLITRYPFAYPGKAPIELIFFRVRHFSGEPQNLIFHDLRWQPKLQLATLDFVEGDREFIHGIYTSAYGNHD